MELGDLGHESEGSSSDEAAQPSRTSKLRKSCELCRSQKARCILVEGCTDRCQRCTRDGKKCVFLAAKARPKRAKSSRARVAEMEEKLDGLMALLEAQRKSQSETTITPNSTPDLTPPPPTNSNKAKPALPIADSTSGPEWNMTSRQRQDILNNPELYAGFMQPMFQSGANPADGYNDVISRGIVGYHQAEEYLQYFQTKNQYFPFIVVPPHTSLDLLRRERPFLLLSVLTYASARSFNKLTKILEMELREVFAKRSVVKGEKSLDLLQGLILYLAWYHFYFDPKMQQLYQLTQIAIAMAMELGIHRPTPLPTTLSFDTFSLLTPAMFVYRVPPDDPEVKRTFLGTYYVSSALSHSIRRPNNLKYTDYIGECCSTFAQNPMSATDQLLQYLVRLQHFQEEVCNAFDYDSDRDLQSLDPARIELLLQTFNRQLEHFEQSFPTEIWDNTQIKLAFQSLRMYLYEIGFHTSAPAPSLTTTFINSWYYSPIRTSTLLACLSSAQSYLDTMLAIPPSTFLYLCLPDFTRLVYALIIIGSFDTPLGDVSTAGVNIIPQTPNFRELANLDHYLQRLHAMTSGILASGNAPGYIFHFNHLFGKRDEWHARTMADPGVRGKCLTDLIQEMFGPHTNAKKNCFPTPPQLEFQGLFGAVANEDVSLKTFTDLDNSRQQTWEDVDFLAEWNVGDMDLAGFDAAGLMIDGNGNVNL